MTKNISKSELIAYVNDYINNKKYDLILLENNNHPFIRTDDNKLIPAYQFFSEI